MVPITDIEAASLIQQFGIKTSEVSDDQWTVTTTLGNDTVLVQHRNPAEFTGYEYDGDLSAVRPTDAPTDPAPAEGEPPLDPAAPTT